MDGGRGPGNCTSDLKQFHYFKQRCDKLMVVTDHKPLVRVFADCALNEVSNTKLFRPTFEFHGAYVPGKTNAADDATSRH